MRAQEGQGAVVVNLHSATSDNGGRININFVGKKIGQIRIHSNIRNCLLVQEEWWLNKMLT